VARVTHDTEHLALLIARRSNHAGPGDVVINRVGLVAFGPDVEQDEVALPNWRGSRRSWLVMRIAAVRVNTDVRRVLRHQVLALERLHDPLLHLELVRAAVAHATAHLLEERRGDFVDGIA